VVILRLFASARQAAGRSRDTFDASTVSDVLAQATARYGEPFGSMLENCTIWLNGDAVHGDAVVTSNDEVAVLPPVSGGC
jgi:molybdopterin synthase sulfur carrier subunit